MKYLILITLSLILFSSCQRASEAKSSSGPQVLATTGMIADLVEKIAGTHIKVEKLIPPALDPHSYELVKGDDEKFAEAQLIFYNGLGLEHGISLKKQIAHHGARAICVSRSILENEPSSLIQVDGLYDPHIWMDISLWMATLDPICEALCAHFPEHQEVFIANMKKLKEEMQTADHLAYQKLQSLPSEKRFLVTSHDAFQYFTKRYLREKNEEDWRKRCTAPEGLAPEAELSVSDLVEVFSYIQEHHIAVLFTESNMQAQGVKKLLDTGKKKGLALRIANQALYADSMGEAHSYLEMIQHNIDLIAEELGR